jgi:hypothetical protein
MIKLVKKEKEKKSKKSKTPYYMLEYDYMIGDANGNTTEEAKISAGNPFVERYVKLLNKLKPVKGSWGVQLERSDIYGNFKEKRITKDDLDFLNRTMFSSEDEDEEDAEAYFKTPEENSYANELHEGVRAEAEYSFLVFEGVNLTYIDEYGKSHETKIVRGK